MTRCGCGVCMGYVCVLQTYLWFGHWAVVGLCFEANIYTLAFDIVVDWKLDCAVTSSCAIAIVLRMSRPSWTHFTAGNQMLQNTRFNNKQKTPIKSNTTHMFAPICSREFDVLLVVISNQFSINMGFLFYFIIYY